MPLMIHARAVFPRPRRPIENQGLEQILFDGSAKEGAWADDLFLSIKLLKGTGPHPNGKGRTPCRIPPVSMLK